MWRGAWEPRSLGWPSESTPLFRSPQGVAFKYPTSEEEPSFLRQVSVRIPGWAKVLVSALSPKVSGQVSPAKGPRSSPRRGQARWGLDLRAAAGGLCWAVCSARQTASTRTPLLLRAPLPPRAGLLLHSLWPGSGSRVVLLGTSEVRPGTVEMTYPGKRAHPLPMANGTAEWSVVAHTHSRCSSAHGEVSVSVSQL